MNCTDVKRKIPMWLDSELADNLQIGLKAHIDGCVSCKKEAEHFRTFRNLLTKSAPQVEPSPNFEARFWAKVTARQKEPKVIRIFQDIVSFIPVPNLAQAAAVMLIVVLIGGGAGFVSAMNTPEIKGISSSSVASNYLKWIESENLK